MQQYKTSHLFSRILSFLLTVVLFIVNMSLTAQATITSPGWTGIPQFYIGKSQITDEYRCYNTSLGGLTTKRPIVSQDLPANIGLQIVDVGASGVAVSGTAIPGTLGMHEFQLQDPDGGATTILLNIFPGPQTIDPIWNYDKMMGDANFIITPQSRDGNGEIINVASAVPTLTNPEDHQPTYTFVSSEPSVATINNTTGQVTITGWGTTRITVSSAATISYAAASDITFDITVGSKPVFTTHPGRRSVTAGQNTSFTVEASGIPDPTYQWQVSTDSNMIWNDIADGGIYSGADIKTLMLTNVQLSDNNNQYRCLASNSVQSDVISNVATLMVTLPPTVTSVNPDNNTTNVTTDGSIVIEFSEAMETAGTVSLSGGSNAVNTTGSWSTDKQTYTIGYSGLDWETDYTITVEDFEDAAGNVMDPNPVTSDFTTMAQPTGPYVTPTSLTITTSDTGTFEVYLGESGNEAASADITSSDTSIATVETSDVSLVDSEGEATSAVTTGNDTSIALVDTVDVYLEDDEGEAAIATSSNASIAYADTFDVYLEDDEDEAAIATGSNASIAYADSFDVYLEDDVDEAAIAATANSNASIALMDASVTTSGQTITVTGISPGTATITIRFSGGSYSGGSQTVRVTVQDPPDTLSPTVANITPSGTGVSRSDNLAITFSEKMDSAPGTVSLNGAALTGTGTWTNSGMTYTIPYSGLLYNTTYTITISGFKDAEGNVMTADGSHSFTTISSSGGSSSGSSSGSSTASGNSKWSQDGVGWKYKKADGTYAVDGWQQIFWNGRTDWYFFGADGYMKTGWMFWKNDWFYLHPVSDGTMGHMHSGWTMVDGVWYYMYTANDKGVEGAMLVNTVTPDGYQVNANGAWIP